MQPALRLQTTTAISSPHYSMNSHKDRGPETSTQPHIDDNAIYDKSYAVSSPMQENDYYVRETASSASNPYASHTSTTIAQASQYQFISSQLPSVTSSPSPHAVSPPPTPSKHSMRTRSGSSSTTHGSIAKQAIAHPYARLYNKKYSTGKRRKMWNHALEKLIFTPLEITTMGAPHRRTIYLASVEAHIDRLHEQLLASSLVPVPLERLEPYRGLNIQTVKSMVSGLQHDATELKLKLLELERANKELERTLGQS